MKTKQELTNEYYADEVKFLKEIASKHAIKEEELFPSPLMGYKMFEHDLSICLIEGIRLKGKRWIKNHETIDDIEVIKEKLWEHKSKLPPELYGDLDDETYYILNEEFKDLYHCWFIDENELKELVNYVKKNISCKTKDIPFYMAKIIHNNLKDVEKGVKWLEAIDMTEECFFGQQNY